VHRRCRRYLSHFRTLWRNGFKKKTLKKIVGFLLRSVSNEIEVCGIIQLKYDGANNNTFKNNFSWETRCGHWKIRLKTFEYQIENPKVNYPAVPGTFLQLGPLVDPGRHA
jgi:hypothetical protein